MFRAIVIAAVAGLCVQGIALADEAPTKSVGLSGNVLTEMPLAPEFAATGDRAFRMRILTLEQGGVVALHDHKSRPSLEYVLSGTATEIATGRPMRMLKAGDVAAANHGTEHWWRNDGDKPVVILAVDIYLPE